METIHQQNPADAKWLLTWKKNPQSQLRLFCFPFAGGGGYLYKPWAMSLPSSIDLYAVQIPGRENRVSEPPIIDMDQLVNNLVEALTPFLQTPFAFFGHSLGGIIAFAVCRELRRRNEPLPAHLFVSCVAAPHLGYTRLRHLSSDQDLLMELCQLGGTPQQVLADPDMRAMMLRLLRADFTLLETRKYAEEQPLNCPITAFGSDEDRFVSIEEVASWQVHTSKSFHTHCFPGGHFYLKDPSISKELLREIAATLIPH
jgi:surfactin synthase thioesterase subunit